MEVFSSAILKMALIKDLLQPVPLHLVAVYCKAGEAQQKSSGCCNASHSCCEFQNIFEHQACCVTKYRAICISNS